MNLNIGINERASYERWKSKGFIELNWDYEEQDQLSGVPSHTTRLLETRFFILVRVLHIPSPLIPSPKRFDVCISFGYNFNEDKISYNLHQTEYRLDKALEYARWKTTVLYHFLKRMDDLPPQSIGEDV